MVKVLISVLVFVICSLFLLSFASASPALNPDELGFDGQTLSNNYDSLVDAYFSNNNVVTAININSNDNNNFLWVPWFKTSSSSQITDLQNGENCNSGQSIDFSHNCMVTDEFSQIGILVSMGKDQTRMNQFYNTVVASKSTYGDIPSWRIYRNENAIEACKPGINSNCDTASDGTARIIIALFTASKNAYFADTAKKAEYAALANKLADDMLTYEVDKTCRPTSFGTVCYWLAGGANVKTGGIASSDFAYTGYYPDAIIAMLEAYANTNDIKYYNAAKDFTLNYLQAANFNNQAFSVPPGKSFKWVVDASGVPKAQCTNTCSPIMWDGYDASRALGMCQANYYAKEMGVQLPNLQKYCDLLTEEHMSSTTSAPLQYYPDGSAAAGSQSGYFAQGLEALHFSGVNSALFKSSLNSALSHYSPQTKTFDYSPSIGVYTTAFSVRALGMGIGRDLNAFRNETITIISPPPATGIASLSASCVYGTANTPAALKSDSTSGSCRTVKYSTPSGEIKIFACEKDGGYVEIYRQNAPAGLDFKACLANGCVVKDNGFARFIPTTQEEIVIPPPDNTTINTTIVIPPPENITIVIPPPAPVASVSDLPVICGPAGTKIIDAVEGSGCRITECTTSAGNIKAKICSKGEDKYEMYLQSPANQASICVTTNCVGSNSGFAAFNY